MNEPSPSRAEARALRLLALTAGASPWCLLCDALDGTGSAACVRICADAGSGAESGRAALRETRFDAVLLDLSLGAAERGALAAELSEPGAPALVLLAAEEQEPQAVAWLARGAEDYLVSGRDGPEAVLAAVRKAVARHRGGRDAARALRLERELGGAVLDSLAAPVLVTDVEGRILQGNAACERIGGWSLTELRGTRVWERVMAPEEQPGFERRFRGWIAGEPPRDHEGPWLARDGGRRWIAWSPTVLLDDAGAIRYMVLTGLDVTERRQAQERERQRLREIAHTARVRTMGEMASEIAHELNQPLSAIINFCRGSLRALDRGLSEAEIRGLFERIGAQAERAVEIIRGVRRLLRKDSSVHVPVDLNALVEEMLGLVEMEARPHGVRIEPRLDARLPKVGGDPVLIEQVLLNLAHNAIEAMAEHSAAERCLRVATAVADGAVEITVSDTGPGLDEAAARSVFEPFYTTKPEGMGMGLSLSRSIVQAHGGELSVGPNHPCGCRFRLVLPVAAPAAPAG